MKPSQASASSIQPVFYQHTISIQSAYDTPYSSRNIYMNRSRRASDLVHRASKCRAVLKPSFLKTVSRDPVLSVRLFRNARISSLCSLSRELGLSERELLRVGGFGDAERLCVVYQLGSTGNVTVGVDGGLLGCCDDAASTVVASSTSEVCGWPSGSVFWSPAFS